MNEAADQIIGLYQRHARAWARRRATAAVDPRWLGRFTAMLPARGRVLDLGCGSGVPIAAHLLDLGIGVTGVDAAPALIAMARAGLPAGDWVVADMRGLDLAARFDGVLAWNSSFHLPQADQRALFAVFARHSAPGAPLMFTSGPAQGVAMGTFEGEPLFHASLDPDAYRALLDGHGFDLVDHVSEETDSGGLTVWLARRRWDAG